MDKIAGVAVSPPLYVKIKAWVRGAARCASYAKQWRILPFLMYFGLGAWAIQADPFGLSSASDKALSDELSRVRAYLYPVAPAPITVVSIDYESIRGLHNQGQGWMRANDWPLAYQDHARILRDLMNPKDTERPAAIFYDIFFERPRELSGSMTPLGRLIKRAKQNSQMPAVYLAGGGSYMPMAADAYKALDEPPLAVSAWEGYGNFYPLHAMLGEPGVPEASPGRAPLAATALYLALCERRGHNCNWAQEQDAAALALQWEVLDKPGCSTRDPIQGWQRVLSGIESIVGRMLGITDRLDIATPACLPFHQVRLADLYAEKPVSLKPPHLAAGEPYAVLVGVVMKSMNDYHQTPLYGQIQGVYLHAAALENLDRLGEGYIRDRDIRGLSIAVWLLLLSAFWVHRIWRKKVVRAPRRKAQQPADTGPRVAERPIQPHASWMRTVRWALGRFALWVLFALAIVCLYVSFYVVGDIAPEGWLSLIALVPLLRQVVAGTENKLEQGNGEKN